MSSKNRVTFIYKSASLNSLHMLSTTDNSILTSTTTQALTSKIPVDLQRRKALIPTPNRPPVVTKSSAMSDEQEPSMTDKTINQPTSQDSTDDSLRLNSLVDDQYLETSLHQKYPEAHTSDIVSSIAINSQDHRQTSIVDNGFDEYHHLCTAVIAPHTFIESSYKPDDSDILARSDENKNHDFQNKLKHNSDSKKHLFVSTFRLSMQSFSRKETTKRRRWMENLEFTHLYRETCTDRFEERERKTHRNVEISDERRKRTHASRRREREKIHDDVQKRRKRWLTRKSTFLFVLLVRERVEGTSGFCVILLLFFLFFFFTSFVLLFSISTHSMVEISPRGSGIKDRSKPSGKTSNGSECVVRLSCGSCARMTRGSLIRRRCGLLSRHRARAFRQSM
jgi:hypothetical protein